MRLYEILNEQDFPEIDRVKKLMVPNLYKKDLPGKTELGSGGFATAYADKDNPHEVTKGSAPMFIEDGYTAFLEALSQNPEMQSNPYFPHFNDIKLYKNINKAWPRKSYMVKMESLHEIDTLNSKEEAAIKEHLFGEFYQKPKWNVASIVSHVVRDKEFSTPEHVKDKNLIKAANFIRAVSKKTGFDLDMQPSNMMVRRGRFMPQIVITDPLGVSSKYGWAL